MRVVSLRCVWALEAVESVSGENSLGGGGVRSFSGVWAFLFTNKGQ